MSGNRMRSWIQAHSGGTYSNFIGGQWVPASNGKTYTLYESALPANKLGEFPDSDETDVERAVAAADEAFQTWKDSPASVRAKILYRFAELLEQHKEELAYMLSAEQGKVLGESFGEVQRAANEARFCAGEALRVDGQTLPGENAEIRTYVVRYPIGVVAAIAPWNFPVVTPVRKIAPALAYGCTVVYKPSSATPWTSVKLMELLAEAGVPGGVVNMVTGSGSKVGDPLVSHPAVKGITFTGSTGLGRRIAGIAASRLAKLQLELGGKNAALVLDYDNLDFAAEQIVSAAFACSGQRCTAISRVIVLKDKAETLIAQLKEKMSRIKVGPAWAEGVTMGPLIDKKQFETVMKYIEAGKEEGAELVFGGERLRLHEAEEEQNEGYYLSPALFTNVQKHMSIAREEIFGPVLCVMEAEDIEEAADIANSTDYGLAASVFTNSLQTAQRLTSLIDSGMIHINHGTASQIHVPFGGMKKSGYGAYSIGHSNQEFFTGMKAVYIKS